MRHLTTIILLFTLSPVFAEEVLPYRWFFSFGYDNQPKDIEKIKELINIASKGDLNGMVLSSFNMDGVTSWSSQQVKQFQDLVKYSKYKNIEIIPTGFSIGYGGHAIAHNRSFAAALPTNINLIVQNNQIIPQESPNLFKNGDLEKTLKKNSFAHLDMQEAPGIITFADTTINHGTCLRFENFTHQSHGNARIMQKIKVTPQKSYQLEFLLKAEDIFPSNGIKAMIYTDGKVLMELRPTLENKGGFQKINMEWINTQYHEISLYIGLWSGQKGKFWIDEIEFKENNKLNNIVRREGTPIKLFDHEKVYIEGKDFLPFQCLKNLEKLSLTPSSTLTEGSTITLSCYQIPYVYHSWGKQISLCMSNDELYDYWKDQAKKLYELAPYQKFLLSMDEIRNGGGCQNCQSTQLSLGKILGNCIQRQVKLLKKINPDIEILIWSDMLDPHHNAHDHFFQAQGDFNESWRHIPKELIIMCWYNEIKEKSLSFFAKEGFRTMGACYYDGPDLKESQSWLEQLKQTPLAMGIMYTSWKKNYHLLEPFTELASKK